MTTTRRPIVLTTDIGTEVDDQWALSQLAISPELELRGVVTTHAKNLPPPAAEFTAKLAREVLSHLFLAECPPVFVGSSVPLVDKASPLMNSGVEFIIEQSRSFSPANRLSVLTIGAATDVASAMIADPTLEERIEIISMGFLSLEDGGQEWNIQNDVKAWQVLLDSQAPVTVGDAAVCKRYLPMSMPKAREIFGSCGPVAEYLMRLLAAHIRAMSGGDESAIENPDVCAVLWDQVTAAYLLGFAEAPQVARPVLRDDLSFAPRGNDEGRITRWISRVDAEGLWGDFGAKMKDAGA